MHARYYSRINEINAWVRLNARVPQLFNSINGNMVLLRVNKLIIYYNIYNNILRVNKIIIYY